MQEAVDSGLGFAALFGAVLLVRFLLPFVIFRFPLPGVIACLVVDAADQTIFQWFGYDPPFYQSYDKAMDVFYLAIAYLSVMRNWASVAAAGVARILFYWRQLGVALFEQFGLSWLLLVFPNTFEYFFITAEGMRGRWDLRRIRLRTWVLIAAFIWVFVKLPQEWWIHIAKLDFTDALRDYPWFGVAVVVGIVLLLLVFLFVVRPRLDPADHPFMLRAPALPVGMRTAEDRRVWLVEFGRVWSWPTLDKAILVGLLGVIFGSLLPGFDPRPRDLAIWAAVVVVVNAVFALRQVRRGRIAQTIPGSIAVHGVVNVALAVLAVFLAGEGSSYPDAILLGILFAVVIALYDVYRPVYEWRTRAGTTADVGTLPG
jgi:hypothetical protein